MKFFRNSLKIALTVQVFVFAFVCPVLAGPDSLGAAIDSLAIFDPNDPTSFISPEATSGVEVAITILLGLFAGLIPGLRSIKMSFVRSAAAALLVIAGAGTFKLGFLTPESFEYVLKQFLPNFAYAGLIYNALKYLLPMVGGWLGKEWNFFKSVKPAG